MAGEVILGDGSYIFTLERRGYAKAGMWTAESAAEHPDAVHQLGIEFARAGADVTQTFSFWCHEDKLPKGCKFSVRRFYILNKSTYLVSLSRWTKLTSLPVTSPTESRQLKTQSWQQESLRQECFKETVPGPANRQSRMSFGKLLRFTRKIRSILSS